MSPAGETEEINALKKVLDSEHSNSTEADEKMRKVIRLLRSIAMGGLKMTSREAVKDEVRKNAI